MLDAKDLINIFERGMPLEETEFAEYLSSGSRHLVLTFTSVREFAAGFTRSGDFLKLRALLQKIEALPVKYLRDGDIQEREVVSASEAFKNSGEPEAIYPYVKRWDYTLGEHPATALFVNYRLDDLIYDIWHKNPRSLHFSEPESKPLKIFMGEQRKLRHSEPKSDKRIFKENAAKWLDGAGISLTDIDHAAWGEWVYGNPKRCPALTLQFQVLREIVRNKGDKPKRGDIPDLAHVPALPYVDLATMDKRMVSYVTQASKILKQLNPQIHYESKLFKDFAALLNHS